MITLFTCFQTNLIAIIKLFSMVFPRYSRKSQRMAHFRDLDCSKWPIMDRFHILRYLWKCLDKMLQSIILEFSKTASLVAKNVTKKTF